MWREGLGMWKILSENKKGYQNHPATKEFKNHLDMLWERLYEVRDEMIKRGYHPKTLPNLRHTPQGDNCCVGFPIPWQTLEEQIEVIRLKNCKCKV